MNSVVLRILYFVMVIDEVLNTWPATVQAIHVCQPAGMA